MACIINHYFSNNEILGRDMWFCNPYCVLQMWPYNAQSNLCLINASSMLSRTYRKYTCIFTWILRIAFLNKTTTTTNKACPRLLVDTHKAHFHVYNIYQCNTIYNPNGRPLGPVALVYWHCLITISISAIATIPISISIGWLIIYGNLICTFSVEGLYIYAFFKAPLLRGIILRNTITITTQYLPIQYNTIQYNYNTISTTQYNNIHYNTIQNYNTIE